MKNSKIAKNTIALYAMNIAKMILPLITLPYLTRVLTKDCYGTISYVKAVMQYMQLFVDFGFLLSGTKNIVKTINDKEKLEKETGDILFAKIILSGLAFMVLLILVAFIPILRVNISLTLLSFVTVFLTCFLFDYFFRGTEEMQVIAKRFVLMKLISSALTFVFVKNDSDVLWIPILDILGSIFAIVLVVCELKKRNIRIRISNIKNIVFKIKESFVYFVSDMATTAFNALNTVLIGLFLTEGQVADWSICMQMVSAVQSMYSPIINSIYPEMVKNKNIKLIKKVLKIFMPMIIIGCIFTFLVAEPALVLIGGKQYITATLVLRTLIPLLFISFPAMLFGWPALGAISKEKQVTKTTICAALVQIIGLILLAILNQFTLLNIAILRCVSEFLLFFLRFFYCRKYKLEFTN